MKKILFLLAIITMIICINSCDISSESDETPKETINFDVSVFDDYGELSCGRIWCSKIEGSWDTPNEEKFAYFDCDGNQISEWFNMEDYDPQNYNNDFVILYKKIETPPVRDRYPVTILDINGKRIVSDFDVVYKHHGGAPYLIISEFNSEGMACCCVDDWTDGKSKRALYWIDKNGEHKFNFDASEIIGYYPSPDSMNVERLNNNVVLYLNGGYTRYYFYVAVFSNSGNLVLDVSEAIGGYGIREISMHGENLRVTFRGADNKNYNCVIDFQGNFIEQPS